MQVPVLRLLSSGTMPAANRKAAPLTVSKPSGLDSVQLRFAGQHKRTKVSIIGGAGKVGESAASDMARAELCNEIALLDLNGNAAKARALDLEQACSVYGSDTKLVGGDDYSLIKDSDIVVVTAGSPRRPGMTRDDMLVDSTKVIANVAKQIKQHAPNAIVIMVSNPLDVMCHVMQKVTGFPPNRVFGMAGVLDAARFKTAVARELGVAKDNIHTSVVGEHGNDMVPLPGHSTVSGQKLTDKLPPDKIKELIERTRNGGAEIVNLAGTSGYKAPGASIAKMVEVILRDKQQVLPCSAYVNGQYGLNGQYIGVPVKLGRNGVEQVEELKLTPEEQQLFAQSAAKVQTNSQKADALLAKLNP